jgi:hypothetical protein
MFLSFIIHSGFIIWNYLEFSSSANRKYVDVSSMPFPAVTVCSTNPFKANMIESNVKLSKVSLDDTN